MGTVSLWGSGVKGRSSNVSAQKRINLYADAFQGMEADKGQYVLYTRPGLYPRILNQRPIGPGPIRGVIATQYTLTSGPLAGSVINSIIGAQGQYSISSQNNAQGFLTSAPTPVLQTNDGPVVFADNGIQVLGVDGKSAYISYYSAGAAGLTDISTIPVANFPYGARTICALASRFIVDNPAYPGRFNWSATLDYSSWSALDFATAESDPDALVGVYAWRGELLLVGTRSVEFWAPTGDTSVFARVSGSVVPWGCVSYQTIQQVDSSLFMLARNVGGDAEVIALQGYQAQAVSTPDVEYDINQNLAGGAIKALVVRKQGHTFYVLNLPNKTWAYNATTGEWDEWQTDGGRWAGEYAFYAYGTASVTDYRDSRIYGLSDTVYQDDASAMLRQVDTRHVAQDMDRLTVSRVALDMEYGTGLNSGQGSDPQVALQVSRDGGHTFGNELWTSLGAQGKYRERVEWWRLGRARDFVFRFKIFDAVKAVFIGASMDVSK